MSEYTREQVQAGTAMYNKLVLLNYDWFILGLNCRLLWGCPPRRMLDLYNEHVTANHLDIGVGTGYFMAHCRFPSPHPRLVLMDLNPNSLKAASRRLAHYHPEVYLRNALEPFNLAPPLFDSVGMMNLLHCLPGNMETKEAVLINAREVLNPGGTIFGSTILYNGVKRGRLAKLVLKLVNRLGFMSNMDDDVETLKASLARHFSRSEVRIIGHEALFWARK